jgi:hypothetical protein
MKQEDRIKPKEKPNMPEENGEFDVATVTGQVETLRQD